MKIMSFLVFTMLQLRVASLDYVVQWQIRWTAMSYWQLLSGLHRNLCCNKVFVYFYANLKIKILCAHISF